LHNVRHRLSVAYASLIPFGVRETTERKRAPADRPIPAEAAKRPADHRPEPPPASRNGTGGGAPKGLSAGSASVPFNGGKAIPTQASDRGASVAMPRNNVGPILWEPDSPLNDILERTPSPGEDAGRSTSAGGSLANGAYWIHSAADAAGCDFLVHDDLLDPDQSGDSCRQLSELWERPRPDPEGARVGIQTITLAELFADRPKAGRLLHDSIQRSMQLTRDFYRLRRPLEPASARIVRREAGALLLAETGENEPLDPSRLSFEGVIYLNNGYQAGARFFPHLSIGVQPKSGMLVAATRSSYHRSVVQRLTSGSQLTLEFTMTCRER
jgi:hypothetical protein